jgi:hypothetical protein
MGIYKMYVQGEKKSTKSANRKYESDGSKNDSQNMAQFILFLFNIFLSFSSPHEVQANPRSSDGGEEDRKSEKSERSEHSEPQQPEPEVEAVVAAVNEVVVTFSIQDQ